MSRKHTLHIRFYLRKVRTNKNNECPIYMRVTVDGNRRDISLNRWVHPDNWISIAGQVKGTKPLAKAVNKQLETTKTRILEIFNNFMIKYELITADLVLILIWENKDSKNSEGTMERYKASLMIME